MRTLKKTLSLVLVLAMVCSFFVMGTSAAFEDSDEITAKYAGKVEVMNALKILQGSDGEFNPQGTLTRAQAARIIVAMLQAENLAKAATCTFTDVATTDWFYDEIAYCQSIGIMKGNGDGTVAPNGELTGPQFALMLLKAVGVDTSKINPATYALDTVALAYDCGFGTVAELTTEPFTREIASSLAFAALNHSETVKTVYDVYNTAGTAVVDTFDSASEAYFYKSANAGTTGKIESRDVKLNTLASNFGLKSAGYEDSFGRPGTIYTASDWELPVILMATPVASYTTLVSAAKIYTDLGKPAQTDIATVTHFVDGNTGSLVKTDIASGDASTVGGNGVLTEVYVRYNAAGKLVIDIVTVNTYVGTIATHNPAVLDANGDVSTKENVTLTQATKKPAVIAAAFNTAAFTELDEVAGTTVLYTAAYVDTNDDTVRDAYRIMSVVAAESKTLVATNRTSTTFISGGVTYKYSEQSNETISAGEVSGKTPKVVYLDEYGYVIKVAAPDAAASKYAYVLNYGQEGVMNGLSTYYAQLLYSDGTVETVVVSAPANSLVGKLVTWEEGTGANTGKIVLDSGSNAVSTSSAVAFATNDVTYGTHKVNSKTTFVVQTIANGVPTYTVYTGNNALVGLEADDATHTGLYVGIDADSDTYADLIYILDAELSVSGTVAADLVYIIGASADATADVTMGSYNVYNAIVNGKITTVKGVAGLDGFYGVTSANKHGIIELGYAPSVAVSASYAELSGNGTKVGLNGVIELGGADYSYNADTLVYFVNPYTNVITAGTLGEIGVDANDEFAALTYKGMLQMIVITVIPNP